MDLQWGGTRVDVLHEPTALYIALQGDHHITLAYFHGIFRVVGKPQATLGGILVPDVRYPRWTLLTPGSPYSWGRRYLVTHDGKVRPGGSGPEAKEA